MLSLQRRWLMVLALSGLSFCTVQLKAQPAIEREFDFARGLIRLNMPDFAEQVMDRLMLRHPDFEQRANVVRAEAMIHRRRLDAAEAILRDMPADSTSAQAIRLALADAYFQVGQREKTRAIYTEFFRQYEGVKPTDPDVIRFLRESAYKYAQMLIYDQDFRGAVTVYDLLLDVVTVREERRQIMLEQAESALKAAEAAGLSASDRDALHKKAEKNFTEVLWGGMDLWFGRALISYAQYMALRGERDEARRMLQSNIPIMRDIDQQLREMGIPIAESPMAGARSLLGNLYMEEGNILVAPDPERHNEALANFERAVKAFSDEWRVMERAKRREDAARAQGQETDASLRAVGGRPERMQPYNDLIAALEGFLATATQAAWDSGVTERARKLETDLRALYNRVREFDFAPGISPNLGIAIDEGFAGNVALNTGRSLLRTREERTTDAVQLLVRALTEYYNVFADYAGSHWSTTAGEIVGELRNILFELTGRNVVINVGPGQEERIANVYLKEGHSLFSRERYPEALEQYLTGVNAAPESGETMIALSNMMEAYAKLEEPYTVRMLARYVSERFADRAEAAQALLRIGRHYFDGRDMEMYHELYELFLERFPEHERAPMVLFMLGEQQWRIKDYLGAAVYYRRIVERYPRSPQSLTSMNRIGWGYFLSGSYSNAVAAFNDYIQVAPASQEKAQAQLCLAESLRMSNQPVEALEAYEKLIEWLTPDPNAYTASAEQQRQNREIQIQAHFFRAFCHSQINEPAENIARHREQAIELYQVFIELYPRSRLAPIAMASLGAIYFERGRAEEAARTFEQLSERYPDSEAGQNARFAMIRSLVDIRQMEKAKEVFEEMLEDAERYSEGQFVRVAQLMLDRGEYEAAEKAFLLVKGRTEERSLLERTLFGLGQAQIELGKYVQAVDNLNELNRRYPNSGRFFDARFLLGRALAEQDKNEEAIRALHDVFTRATDAELINRASFELAQLQLRGGDSSGALASFQRIVLLGDPEDPEKPAVRPIYRQAVLQSIQLYRDLRRWDDVIENCDRYMRYFTLGEEAEQVRRWRSEALMQRASGG